MKTLERNLGKVVLSIITILIIACSSDDSNSDEGPNPGPDLSSFESVIAIGEDFEAFPDSRKTDTLSVSDPVNEDYDREEGGEEITERFVCNTKTVSITDGNGDFPLFNTTADVIYPGSLLQGKTLSNATPAPIVVKRAGGTISYNLNNGNLQSSFTVDEVKKSTIQTGMNTIIANAGEVVPANFKLEIIQIESESQMALEMGIDIDTWTTQVSSEMAFSSQSSLNRTLIKLNQAYYTMSFDLPTSLQEIFDESVTPEQLSTYVQADNPATFISSVTYGRIFYMLVESTSSRQEMEAKLNVAYGSFGNTVSGELEVNAFQSLENLKIKVIAYGGDAAGTFELTGETTVEAIANKLAESTDIRAGLPLSYVVRSVERPDQIVGTSLATQYDVVDCTLKGILPTENYLSMVDIFEDGIGAATQIAGSNIAIYNKAGNQYAIYNVSGGEVLGVFDITDTNGPLAGIGLESVGAAARFANGSIYFFDSTGLKTHILGYDPSGLDQNPIPDGPIGTYRNDILLVNDIYADEDVFPFVGDGFDAATRFIIDHASPAGNWTIYFSTNGSEFADYNSGNGQWFLIEQTNSWIGTPGKLFDKVGAAARLEFGGGTTKQILFFNFDGDQIMTWEPANGGTFKGPWVIN